MIFATAGTTNFPFRRLEKLVIQLQKIFPKEQIIFQNVSVTEIALPENVRVEEDVPPATFEHYLRTAKIIVAHGGYATVMQGIRYAKTKPLILPRLKRFGEHVNDHQLYFARYMERKGLVSVIEDYKKTQSVIANNKRDQELVRKYDEKVQKQKKLLINYLMNEAGSINHFSSK